MKEQCEKTEVEYKGEQLGSKGMGSKGSRQVMISRQVSND